VVVDTALVMELCPNPLGKTGVQDAVAMKVADLVGSSPTPSAREGPTGGERDDVLCPQEQLTERSRDPCHSMPFFDLAAQVARHSRRLMSKNQIATAALET
jgi:hypothetical protein